MNMNPAFPILQFHDGARQLIYIFITLNVNVYMNNSYSK